MVNVVPVFYMLFFSCAGFAYIFFLSYCEIIVILPDKCTTQLISLEIFVFSHNKWLLCSAKKFQTFIYSKYNRGRSPENSQRTINKCLMDVFIYLLDFIIFPHKELCSYHTVSHAHKNIYRHFTYVGILAHTQDLFTENTL